MNKKTQTMKPLTNKEEEIMNHYWDHGAMHIRQLQALYADPKPHVNTLSTLVHILEDKGFLSHEAVTLGNVVNKFFNRSYLGVVSALVKEEKISVDDLRELIKKVEEGK